MDAATNTGMTVRIHVNGYYEGQAYTLTQSTRNSGGYARTVRTFILLQGGLGEQRGLQVQLAESEVACQG